MHGPKRFEIMTIDQIIDEAIREDVGDGDHSSLACIPSEAKGKAQLLVKENGILAGIDIALRIFNKVDPFLLVETKIKDGTPVFEGDVALYVSGSKQSILKAERLVLNIMQRMSGIASYTNKVVKLLEGTNTKVLDTRKTTPLLRELEKMAVVIGGGVNHRIGLYDMIMLKDNHIDYAGGIDMAIAKTKKYLQESNKDLKIEVEARDLTEVQEILAIGGIDRIMLDNFSYEDTKMAVDLIDGRYEIESSGGITLETVAGYAACGVDFISLGALTHSVKSMDLSLKAIDQ